MRKIENSIKTEYFADGIVYLYPLTNVGEPDGGRKLKRYFGERNMTYKRIMDAMQVQSEYSRLICVPLTGAGAYGKIRCAEISGRRYRVESVQEISSALPPVAILSLSDWDADTRI